MSERIRHPKSRGSSIGTSTAIQAESSIDASAIADRAFDSYLYSGKRSFEAGLYSRENSTWATIDLSPAQELFLQIDLLRVRSRDLYRNGGIVNSFVTLNQNNVIGPKGFTFKSTVKTSKNSINTKIARQIEEAWTDFTRLGNFDVSGKYGVKDALDVMDQSLIVDGEIIIRKRYDPKYKWGFAIQMLHAEQLLTKQQYQIDDKQGNHSYMLGIENDEDNRPISYCLTNKDPRDGYVKYLFEPAERVIHAFTPYMLGANRGVPAYVSGMNHLRMLEEYIKAEMIAARVGASAFIKYTQKQPDDLELSQEQMQASILQSGPKRNVIEPGTGMVLPPDCDAEYMKSEHPTTAFDPFVRAVEKYISAAFGVSSNSIFADFEHTSFSSMRAAFIMERNYYRKQQVLFIEKVLTPIFEAWLDCACASGKLNLPPVMGNYDYYKSHVFTGVPFTFVDPYKEAQAQQLCIANRTMSRTRICEDQGFTYGDMCEDFVNEQATENEKGLTFAILPKNTELVLAPADIVGEVLSQPPLAGGQQVPGKALKAKKSKAIPDPDTSEDEQSDL
jgi:lambda family phage portal protein